MQMHIDTYILYTLDIYSPYSRYGDNRESYKYSYMMTSVLG